jgi:hypothetical protein
VSDRRRPSFVAAELDVVPLRLDAGGAHHRDRRTDTIRRTRPVRENRFENSRIVRRVQIVQSRRRFVTVWHGMEAMGRRWTGLRAWSGITGWRFESSSAHLKALQIAGFLVGDRVLGRGGARP